MGRNSWTLGIESTAHTFSFGLVDSNGIPYPSISDTVRPLEGGIHPREAADHHRDYSSTLFQQILDSQNLQPSDIGAVAYSQGPVLGPLVAEVILSQAFCATAESLPLLQVLAVPPSLAPSPIVPCLRQHNGRIINVEIRQESRLT